MKFGFLVAVLAHSVCSAQTDYRGLQWEDDAYHQQPLKFSYFKPATSLPASYSLKKYCPRVVNQASTNTSVAWAAVWYAKTISEAARTGAQDVTVATRNAYSPAYNYRKSFKGEGCDDPVRLTTVLRSLQWDGALPFSAYQELCPADSATDELNALAAKNKLPGFVRLFNTTDSKEIKIRTMKEALSGNHAVVTGIICTPSFSLANEFWQPREEPAREAGGHALCIVGYDDDAYGGAFEVVNSWGKSWGSGGFTWLRYEDVGRFVIYGYELIGNEIPEGTNLKASVSLTQVGGAPMTGKIRNEGYYKLLQFYPTGTQFQVKAEMNANLFFYAIGFDEKRNHEVMYPPEKSVYPWLSPSEHTLILPDPSRTITLTEPAGKNYLLFIFSGREIKREELIKRLKESKGDFGATIYSNKLNSPSAVWAQNEMAFNTEWNSDTLVAMVVELDQVH